MDHLPIARSDGAAAVLGSRIFLCGGGHAQYRRSCNSYDLDEEEGGWLEEASMVSERESFGLSSIRNILVANGGYNSAHGGPLSSVEVFTPARNRMERRDQT